MSMHNIELTELEREGLKKHHLKTDSASQLSDCFRHGVKWALDNHPSHLVSAKDELKATSVSHAFETIKQAMIDDEPSKLGSYAHSWHCNIAMALSDEMQSKTEKLTYYEAHQIANQAASRFMKMCFDVETSMGDL